MQQLKKLTLSMILASASSIAIAGLPPLTPPPMMVGYYQESDTQPLGISQVQDLDVLNYAFLGMDNQGNVQLVNANSDIGTLLPWVNGTEPPTINLTDALSYWSFLGSPDPQEGGNIATGGNFAAMCNMKALNPDLKVLMSIGGWNGSANFSAVAANHAPQFAASVAQAVKGFTCSNGQALFDGIDIDWEFPVVGNNIPHTPADKQNYVSLLANLRSSLGSQAIITFAGPFGNGPAGSGTAANFDLQGMLQYANWVNVMSYDLGNDLPLASYNAPLFLDPRAPAGDKYTTSGGLQDYKNAGLDPTQLMMGMPLYYTKFTNVAAGPNGDGVYQPGTYVNQSTLPNSSISWLIANVTGNNGIEQAPAYQETFLDTQKNLYFYDTATTVTTKSCYVNPDSNAPLCKLLGNTNQIAGGMMFWDIAFDSNSQNAGGTSLINTAYQSLKNAAPPTAPQSEGTLTICNSSDTANPSGSGSWLTALVDDAQSKKSMGQMAINFLNNPQSTQPICQTYQAPFSATSGQSQKVQIEVQNSATATPKYTTCLDANGTPLQYQTSMSPQTIYVYQDAYTQKAYCSTSKIPQVAYPVKVLLSNSDSQAGDPDVTSITLISKTGQYYVFDGLNLSNGQQTPYCNTNGAGYYPGCPVSGNLNNLQGQNGITINFTDSRGTHTCPADVVLNLSAGGQYNVMVNPQYDSCAVGS
jgi:GH18 family chitinase